MAGAPPNKLLVEATDDLGAVTGLMRHFVKWGDNEGSWPAVIEMAGSADELLDRVYLQTQLKSSGLKSLGIVIDADDKFSARWQSIKDFCKPHFDRMPDKIPAGGLIVSGGGIQFGAWIMPDNKNHGMLETFCHSLVPSGSKKLWEYACTSCDEAKRLGGSYKETHKEKSTIHTWLAWQDPPGERMGNALTMKILDPTAACAKPFVEWFIKLFGATRLGPP